MNNQDLFVQMIDRVPRGYQRKSQCVAHWATLSMKYTIMSVPEAQWSVTGDYADWT